MELDGYIDSHITKELSFFIRTYFIFEVWGLLEEGYALLVEAGEEGIEQILDDAVGMDQTVQISDMTDNFRQTIEDGVKNVLKQHGFVIAEEAPLEFTNKLLRALMMLPDYEDKQSIITFLDITIDLVEKVHNLLKLVVDIEISEMDMYIESINPAFFTALRSTCLDVTSDEDVPDEEQHEHELRIIRRIKKYAELTKSDTLIAMQLLRQNTLPGLPMDAYLSQVISPMMKFDDKSVALELLGILIISKEGMNLVHFEELSTRYFTDPIRVGKIMLELSRLVGMYSPEIQKV